MVFIHPCTLGMPDIICTMPAPPARIRHATIERTTRQWRPSNINGNPGTTGGQADGRSKRCAVLGDAQKLNNGDGRENGSKIFQMWGQELSIIFAAIPFCHACIVNVDADYLMPNANADHPSNGICKPGPILIFVGDSCMTIDPVFDQGFTIRANNSSGQICLPSSTQPSTTHPHNQTWALA
mmetsp:Transcript_2911/g.6229  ORF Transcript_2911/g.6229 Transcript_2911/m.6229 type:complete len:182 (-) Transcript_2911:192-737(-)